MWYLIQIKRILKNNFNYIIKHTNNNYNFFKMFFILKYIKIIKNYF
jgi:hypothetical protein